MPRARTVPSELAGAIRRGEKDGRLGPEHRLDVVRARLLVEMLTDEATPRSAIAALDRRLDIVLTRLGLVAAATGPTELEAWLAAAMGETVPDDEEEELEELEAERGEGDSAPGSELEPT